MPIRDFKSGLPTWFRGCRRAEPKGHGSNNTLKPISTESGGTSVSLRRALIVREVTTVVFLAGMRGLSAVTQSEPHHSASGAQLKWLYSAIYTGKRSEAGPNPLCSTTDCSTTDCSLPFSIHTPALPMADSKTPALGGRLA